MIHMPAVATRISPKVPGSGVGNGAEAENVPLTNRTVALPFISVAGAKLRPHPPLVGNVIPNSENVVPAPTTPMTLGFRPPESLKKPGLETPNSLLGL